MKEIRKIQSDSVRRLCIREDYYTKGNNAEYANLLNNMCDWDKVIDVNSLEAIALDILAHSDCDKKMHAYACSFEEVKSNLMYCLAEDCCHSFFE